MRNLNNNIMQYLDKMSYLKLAKEQALQSKCNYRLGSIVIRKNKIVGRGCNLTKTHPLMQRNSKNDRILGLHAEVYAAIKTPANKIAGSTIVIVRITRNGKYAMAKPCEVCRKILKRMLVKEIYFSIDNNNCARMTL